MKKLMTAILCLITLNVMAGTDARIKSLSKIDIGGNGSECTLSKINLADFDYESEAIDFRETVEHTTDTVHDIYFKWVDILDLAERYTNDEWMETIAELREEQLIRAMFGAEPDSEYCEEVESCSLGTLKVFFETGDVLDCSFDQTT